MAEPEGKGPLEKPIDWFSGWKASFERIRQRFGMLVAVLLALSVAGGFVWWNWDDIAKRPGVEWILQFAEQRPLPKATAGRLTIAVTHLAHDNKDRQHEGILRDELEHFEVEGVEVLSVDRTVDPRSPPRITPKTKRRTCLRKPAPMFWSGAAS